MVVDRFRAEDRDATDALYRRVFGPDAAEASRLRWDWQYRKNPNNPGHAPLIWVAREGKAIIGQYATMPVALSIKGQDVSGSWGMDVMVAPERQRQGLGEALFGTWDRHVGAALGLGLSPSSHKLFQKLRWPEVGPIPFFVKPLTRRALRRPEWPMPVNRLVSAVTLPYVKYAARMRPMLGEVRLLRRFDQQFTDLWQRVGPQFDLAVRRDADYLQWKYVTPPHVRYTIAALQRESGAAGYIVYRHTHEPRGRVTIIVDFLVEPGDDEGLQTLLRWVDREARAADSDKIRSFCLNAGFSRVLKQEGYSSVKSSLQFVVKVNAVSVPPDFYTRTDRWHIMLGDSDQDR
jgi:GNAT superfamily N-acetyltransferase